MSRDRPSPIALGPAVGQEFVRQPEAAQTSSERRLLTRPKHADAGLVEFELDLIAGHDAKPITHLLREDDLALWTHSMSHTRKYNPVSEERHVTRPPAPPLLLARSFASEIACG